MNTTNFIFVNGETFITDSELAKYLGIDIKYLRNEIALYNAYVPDCSHPFITSPIATLPYPIRERYTCKVLCFNIPYVKKIDAGTFMLSFGDYIQFEYHLLDSMKLNNNMSEGQKQALLAKYQDLRSIFVCAFKQHLNDQQQAIVNRLKSAINKYGYLPGFYIADLLQLNHLLFHDSLYKFYARVGEPPQMYKWNKDTLQYVINENPYGNPLAAVGNFSEPTYGFTASNVSALYRAFPQAGNALVLVEIALGK